MLVDIVIDNNVLMHSDNEQEPRRNQCVVLLRMLRNCQTHLCVDDGFSLDEAKNRSHIGGEYLRHLRFGSIGFAIVSHLAQSSRIRLVPRKVPQDVSKHIRKQVNKGPDRTYVKVAFNSTDKTLASHDFEDLPQPVRDRLRNAIGVRILAADAASVALR